MGVPLAKGGVGTLPKGVTPKGFHPLSEGLFSFLVYVVFKEVWLQVCPEGGFDCKISGSKSPGHGAEGTEYWFISLIDTFHFSNLKGSKYDFLPLNFYGNATRMILKARNNYCAWNCKITISTSDNFLPFLCKSLFFHIVPLRFPAKIFMVKSMKIKDLTNLVSFPRLSTINLNPPRKSSYMHLNAVNKNIQDFIQFMIIP